LDAEGRNGWPRGKPFECTGQVYTNGNEKRARRNREIEVKVACAWKEIRIQTTRAQKQNDFSVLRETAGGLFFVQISKSSKVSNGHF